MRKQESHDWEGDEPLTPVILPSKNHYTDSHTEAFK